MPGRSPRSRGALIGALLLVPAPASKIPGPGSALTSEASEGRGEGGEDEVRQADATQDAQPISSARPNSGIFDP